MASCACGGAWQAGGWDAADAEAVVETHILGVLRVAAAVLPLLKQRPDSTVMATSSAPAFVPRADFPACCAGQAFLHSRLQALRRQFRLLPLERERERRREPDMLRTFAGGRSRRAISPA